MDGLFGIVSSDSPPLSLIHWQDFIPPNGRLPPSNFQPVLWWLVGIYWQLGQLYASKMFSACQLISIPVIWSELVMRFPLLASVVCA